MRVLALFCCVVLAFCWAVYLGVRAWNKISPWRRTLGCLLLLPDLLWILSFAADIACEAKGSQSCYNTQFLSAVLVVFILPVPALLGTASAIALFSRAR